MVDEKALSPEGKAILEIVRQDAAEGRLTPEQAKFLNRAIALNDSLGIIGNVVIKFGAFCAAIATIWTFWPKK